jgi:hypothetical protein
MLTPVCWGVENDVLAQRLPFTFGMKGIQDMRTATRFTALLSVLLVGFFNAQLQGQESPGHGTLFPFVISQESLDNATNVSATMPTPAGRGGFLRVEDGHFVDNAGPVRIWGVNLCFSACFPTHEDAERLAQRLARFGINGVRLHHMDSRDIWGASPNRTEIDPERLERLDYLIAQLKENGIYVNINLHVSRGLDERDGFTDRDQRPKYDKGLDNFEPRLVELQKKYARDLLTHVNPYTGNAYTDEPSVAAIEINNENGLFLIWNNGELDGLPDPYAATFRSQWNAWLREKYGTTAALREAWHAGEAPLGEELLEADRFTRETFDDPWHLQRDAETIASAEVRDSDDMNETSARIVHIDVERRGSESWVPQLMYTGVTLEKGKPYTVMFKMRSDEEREIRTLARLSVEPWGSLGFSRTLPLTTNWTDFQFTFIASNSADGTARIDFTGLEPGMYDLTDLSLREGGIYGLRPDLRLENDSVPIVARGNLDVTEPTRRDFVDFLWATERDYWTGMQTFLKEELGVKAPIAGTQITWSPTHVQAMLDYCDSHAYWNHPSFPNRPWDSQDWYVKNIALVDHPVDGTLTRLAQQRVAGRPFTVSEYNHPAPNAYGAEGFPMLAAMAGFQNWDGIYLFTYSHNEEWAPRHVNNFFDIKGDTTKMAHMIACSNLFLRGDVSPARQTMLVNMDRDAERELLVSYLSPRSLKFENLGADPRQALLHGVAVDVDSTFQADVPDQFAQLPDDIERFASDTGEIYWDVSREEGGLWGVITPRTMVVTGFMPWNVTSQENGVRIRLDQTRLGTATVSLTELDAETLSSPGRFLLTATGEVKSTNATVEDLGADRITLRNEWGDPPLLCEGVPLELTLAQPLERVTVYPLDPSGERGEPIEGHTNGAEACVFSLSAEYKTIWYEIEVSQSPFTHY